MIDSHIIERARAFPIEVIAREHDLRLRGKTERVGACPKCGGHDRFSINIKKRLWNCRGCQQGGDVIALVQFLDGCTFREACAILIGEQTGNRNHKPPHPEAEQQHLGDYERKQSTMARWLWRSSVPITGTIAEQYLRQTRGYRGTIPATLRFLGPTGNYPPAMIAAFGLADEPEPGVLAITEGKITGIHLTRLTSDGRKQEDDAKVFLGSSAGSPIVCAPINDLLGLAITEGIEDALNAHQATGLGSWAAGSANRLPTLAAAIPNYIEAVTIFAHTDKAGLRGAYELATALDERGMEVRIESSFQCPD
jgi:phage/plasmid primase-like uncharacterized protein